MEHCPDWIFDVAACAVAREFLGSPFSLDSVAQKFQKGMAEHYAVIDLNHFTVCAEQVLSTLNDAEAGEDATMIIEGFCYFRLNYEMDKTPRKIAGLFGGGLKGDKEPRYSVDKSRKRFKAYLFAMRNNGMPIPPKGWLLENDDKFPALAELIKTKASVLDSL